MISAQHLMIYAVNEKTGIQIVPRSIPQGSEVYALSLLLLGLRQGKSNLFPPLVLSMLASDNEPSTATHRYDSIHILR